MPQWLKQNYTYHVKLKRSTGEWKKHIVLRSHHESHAASAFYPSPFEEAAILTMDGVGEWDHGTIGLGKATK